MLDSCTTLGGSNNIENTIAGHSHHHLRSSSSSLATTPLASLQYNNITNTYKKYSSSSSSLNTNLNSNTNCSLNDTKEKPFLQLHSSNGVERLNSYTNQSSLSVTSSVDSNQSSITKCSELNDSGSSNSVEINNLNQNNIGDNNNIPKISGRQINKFVKNKTNNLISSNCLDTIKKSKMVAAQEMAFENFSGGGGGTNDDTSEELKYGPGIVSRLRCRYLSLALRQTNTKQRPSLNNMRRATSLNNLLDNEDDECPTNGDGVGSEHHNLSHDETKLGGNKYENGYDIHNDENNRVQTPDEYVESFMKKNIMDVRNEKRSRQPQKRNDSMIKRARSVEALVRYDSKAWEHDVKKESQALIIEEVANVANGNLKDLEPITIEAKIINARERNDPRPRKIAPLLEEKERPPPDVVKEKLRIFEATANKKNRPNTNPRSEVAAKIETFNYKISSEKPAITYPKPPQSPIKKPIAKPRQTAPAPPPPTSPIISENNFKKLDSNRPMSPLSIDLTYRSTKHDSPIANSPILSPLTRPVLTRIPNNTNNTTNTRPESPKTPDTILRKNNLSTTTSTESPITILSNKIKNLKIESPKPVVDNITNNKINDDTHEDDDSTDMDEQDSNIEHTKHISKTALENISKAGSTLSFTFNNTHNEESPLPPTLQPTVTSSPIKSHLPNGQSSTPTSSQSKITQGSYNNNDSTDSNGRQIGVIRPLIAEPKVKFAKSDINGSSGINNSVNNISSTILSDDNNKPINVSISNNINNSSVNSNNIAMEKPTLTLREIEKNLINKEKSSTLLSGVGGSNDVTASPLAGGSKINNSSAGTTSNTTSSSSATNSEQQPLWSLPKKKSLTPIQQPQNTTMVFKFTDRKDVPDYIENAITFTPRRSWPEVSHECFHCIFM